MALPAEQELEEVIIPDGGIADFIISDEDYDELARQEASKTYGESGGIAEFQEQAARMAKYGRGGDQFVAHLAPGEIVVPAPLIENNPELRDSIFGHLREMGIENPEQYVVGASANSINPETGLMEFGFLSRVFKGVKRVVTGAVKTVGKVLKKAAPIVLPIIGTAVLGPVWGAAVGSGIATLINGGSLKDAAISAAISGGIGAVTAGFGGPGSFGQNVSSAMDAGSYLNTVGSRLGSTMQSGEFFSEGSIFGRPGSVSGPDMAAAGAPDASVTAATQPSGTEVASYGDAAFGYVPEGTGTGIPPTTSGDFLKDQFAASQTPVAVTPAKVPSVTGMQTGTYQPNVAEVFGPTPPINVTKFSSGMPGGEVIKTGAAMDSNFFNRSLDAVQDYGTRLYEEPLTTLGDTFFPSGPSPEQITGSSQYANLVKPTTQGGGGLTPDKAFDIVSKKMSPGLIRTYGPLAAAGTAGAAALGFFDTPEPTEEEKSPLALKSGPTGAELLAADVAGGGTKYTLPTAAITPTSATGPTTVASAYGLPESPQVASLQEYLRQQRERLQNPFGPMRAAEGGEVYPRRNGGIMPYEGTPNEDSVRALLMPGEFVMTTNAVKGAGNGDLNRGINNMYGIMRGLERRGRAMA